MENVWVLFALVAAFSLATSDAFTKKALAAYNEYLIAWLRLLMTLPGLCIALLLVPLPALDKEFFVASLVALPFEITAMILYIKALKLSPLSLTLPFLSLTPIFLIIVPHVFLGETVSMQGAMGVLLIAAGGYMLNLKEFKRGIFEPFLAIRREKGSVYMIVVALIFSITSTLGKKAIIHSSPLFFAASYYVALAVFFAPVALYKGRGDLKELWKNGTVKAALLPGFFHLLMIISHMIAISLTTVAYMISVKRLSLLIGVLYGHLFFKEQGIRDRFAGSALMLAGFALIVLSR
ncbi:MAG: EamA family transporter [Nitrospirota bacterium]